MKFLDLYHIASCNIEIRNAIVSSELECTEFEFIAGNKSKSNRKLEPLITPQSEVTTPTSLSEEARPGLFPWAELRPPPPAAS